MVNLIICIKSEGYGGGPESWCLATPKEAKLQWELNALKFDLTLVQRHVIWLKNVDSEWRVFMKMFTSSRTRLQILYNLWEAKRDSVDLARFRNDLITTLDARRVEHVDMLWCTVIDKYFPAKTWLHLISFLGITIRIWWPFLARIPRTSCILQIMDFYYQTGLRSN